MSGRVQQTLRETARDVRELTDLLIGGSSAPGDDLLKRRAPVDVLANVFERCGDARPRDSWNRREGDRTLQVHPILGATEATFNAEGVAPAASAGGPTPLSLL